MGLPLGSKAVQCRKKSKLLYIKSCLTITTYGNQWFFDKIRNALFHNWKTGRNQLSRTWYLHYCVKSWNLYILDLVCAFCSGSEKSKLLFFRPNCPNQVEVKMNQKEEGNHIKKWLIEKSLHELFLFVSSTKTLKCKSC